MTYAKDLLAVAKKQARRKRYEQAAETANEAAQCIDRVIARRSRISRRVRRRHTRINAFAAECYEAAAKTAEIGPEHLVAAAHFWQRASQFALPERAEDFRARSAASRRRFEVWSASLPRHLETRALLARLRIETNQLVVNSPGMAFPHRVAGVQLWDVNKHANSYNCAHVLVAQHALASGYAVQADPATDFNLKNVTGRYNSNKFKALWEWAYGAPGAHVDMTTIKNVVEAAGPGSFAMASSSKLFGDTSHVMAIVNERGRAVVLDASTHPADVESVHLLEDSQYFDEQPDGWVLVSHNTRRDHLDIDEHRRYEIVTAAINSDWFEHAPQEDVVAYYAEAPRMAPLVEAFTRLSVNGFEGAPFLQRALATGSALAAQPYVVSGYQSAREAELASIASRGPGVGDDSAVLGVGLDGRATLYAFVGSFAMAIDVHSGRIYEKKDVPFEFDYYVDMSVAGQRYIHQCLGYARSAELSGTSHTLGDSLGR